MYDVETIMSNAKHRAVEKALPYAGALVPQEAFALLRLHPTATLVDVRTQAERYWVGHVPGALSIEWSTYPGGARNPDFLVELKARVPATSALLMFLCRSGQRSHHAATLATEAGYPNCHNILEGFEGDRDAQGHRNSTNGWRVAGLPWEQS